MYNGAVSIGGTQFIDFTRRVEPEPEVFSILHTYGNLHHEMYWFFEGLIQRLSRFRATMPQLTIDFRTADYHVQMSGYVYTLSDPAKYVNPPQLPNVAVTYAPNAQVLDRHNTFLAASKVFKRVVVSNLDDVIPQNRGFVAGNVEFIFGTEPGQRPASMTWREVARAAMAMLQYTRAEAVDFDTLKEVRATISRDGRAIGVAEINVHQATSDIGTGNENITNS